MVSPKTASVTAEASAQVPPKSATDYERLSKLVFVALALLLRVMGVGWALPTATRFYSYHPDESIVVSAALKLNPFVLKVDPHFYNYGSLSLLLDAAAIQIGSALHLIVAGPIPGIPSAGALLASRLVTVAMGAATCLILYATARLLFGRVAAIATALLYAAAPLAVQHAHWATVDVPATFWIAGSLFFAARASGDKCRKFDFLWCGVWAGLAAATKYNAGIVVLSGCAAVYFNRGDRRGNIFSLVLGTICALLTGSPAILINPSGVFTAIRSESVHVSTGHGDVFTGTVPGLLYHIVVSLNWGLSIPVLAIVLAGVVFALVKRRPADIVLLAFCIPYYLLIGLAQVKFSRYTLPLFPPLLLIAGSLLESIVASGKRFWTAAGVAVYGLAFASALCLSLAFNKLMTVPDTRDDAAAFIHAQSIQSVGFATGPWFFSPTLGPLLSSPYPPVAQQSAKSVTDIRLIPCVAADTTENSEMGAPVEWNTAVSMGSDPDAVAVSEIEYGDALRIRKPSALSFLAAVQRSYPQTHVFEKPLQVFGIRITNNNSTGGLPVQGLPPDMLYTNPTTIVFTK